MMSMSKLRCAVALAIALSGSSPVSADQQPATGRVVVELFTSQGCSSCPPADALLGELTRRADVLPLAFHVTYWNDLGWRDRFSLPEADARQHRYAGALGRRSVYTPQMIINGSGEALGSRRSEIVRLIEAAGAPASIQLSVAPGLLQITLPDVGGCECELLLLDVLPSVQTAVPRGENAGRTLREFNVVHHVTALPAWNGRALQRNVPLRQEPAAASFLVVLAQRRADAHVMAVGVAR